MHEATKFIHLSGITENLRLFFENQNCRESIKRSNSGPGSNLISQQHSISCFPGEDQDSSLSRSSRSATGNKEQSLNNNTESKVAKRQELIIHFHTSLPTMGVFLPGMLEEFAHLLFNINVRVHAQPTSASKILSTTTKHIEKRQTHFIKSEFDANNNSGNVAAPNSADTYNLINNLSPPLNACNADPPQLPANGLHCGETQKLTSSRKRRVAESGMVLNSKDEHFYKYTARLYETAKTDCDIQENVAASLAFDNARLNESRVRCDRFLSKNHCDLENSREKELKKKQKPSFQKLRNSSPNIVTSLTSK